MDKKFYCHYNETTFEILQVGPSSKCDLNQTGIKSFEIPFDPIGKSLISGETIISDWEIIIDDNNVSLMKINKTKRFSNISRINSLNLKELDNIGAINKSIKIFITKRKDPTILLEIKQSKKWKISEDFSVFTDKQFY